VEQKQGRFFEIKQEMNKKSLVVDTNIIFSALIPDKSSIRDLLFESDILFYAPNFLIYEIYAHKEKLIKNSKLNEQEFYIILNNLLECIQFVPIALIDRKERKKAYEFCNDIDVKDTPFVALAMYLNISLWTGDKMLKSGLQKKGFELLF
jgi:predicted nucleic acid-binding protein